VYRQNRLQISLLATIVGIGLVTIFATFIGKEVVKYVSDMEYIFITGAFVVLTSTIVIRFKKSGSHGIAWSFFLGTAISWCIAETLWAVYELVYNVNPFPSIADIFYIGGYPLMFCFLTYYLQPVKKAITKKMWVVAIIISAVLAIPSIYMAISVDQNVTILDNTLATAYPIADAIIFVPALIGVYLFFRGEVNFTWSLICIGIFCLTIGDVGFQFTTFNNTYYTGHPVDIILMCSYIFFSFGVYDHIKIFKKDTPSDSATMRL
jgi:hypothetical protein